MLFIVLFLELYRIETIVDCGTDIGEEKDDYTLWAKIAERCDINRFSHS